jgi:uncharacterized protein (DUF58 family)
MVGLLFGAFVLRPFYRLSKCRIDVVAAPRVSAHERQEFTVTIHNTSERDMTSLRVERPFLPWDGRWIGEPIGVAVVPAHGTRQVRAAAIFVERGEHHLDPFEMAALVPLGLAVGKRIGSSGCRFLVVPRLAFVTGVSIQRSRANREGRRVPRSTLGHEELAGVRPYRAGDPLKHLHVRTWARTGTPHVRQYVEEESEGVLLVLAIDASDAHEERIEAAISLVAGIASSLAASEMGIDYLLFGEEAMHVTPRRGRGALDFILVALAKLAPSRSEQDLSIRAREIAASVSSAIVVCADASPRRRALHDDIVRAGIPAKLFEVVDEGETSSVGTAVESSRIARREPIAC